MQALSRTQSQASRERSDSSPLKRSLSNTHDAPAQASARRLYHHLLRSPSSGRSDLHTYPIEPELDPGSDDKPRSDVGTSAHLTRHILHILRSTLRAPASRPALHTVVFRMRWDFDNYVDDQLQGCFDDLDQTVTLTAEIAQNGEFHTVAMPCSAYVNRQWPAHGQFLLNVVKRAYRDHTLSGGNMLAGDTESDGDFSVRVFYKLGGTSIAISGSFKAIFDAFQQLCWMAAVCRSDVRGHVAFSQAWPRYWRTPSLPDILITIGEPVRLSPKNTDACWHGLFANMPCAYGFTVPLRQERHANVYRDFDNLSWGEVGVGLELPFELMTILAGIKYPLEIDEGIVFRGPSCLLVPTGAYGTVIQWHFHEITSAATLDDAKIYLGEANWFKCTELTRLTTARTFLAYASEIKVTLGTRGSGYERISRCTAKAEPTSLHLSSLSATMGTEGTGIFGANAGASFKLTRGLRANIRTNLLSDCDRLHRSKTQPALVFDETSQRAWLIPELSLLLHALHSWAAVRRQLDGALPFAEASSDGGEAARMAILLNATKAVEQQPNGSETTVMDKTNLFLDMLQQRKESAMFRNQDGGHKLFGKSSHLKAWDYRDLVELKSFPQRRQVKLPSSLLSSNIAWPRLVSDPEMMVFVCGRLSDPIVPTPSAGLCPSCAAVPHGSHVLVATMRCLQQTDCQSGSLDGLKWRDESGSDPFGGCRNHLGGLKTRIQSLQTATGRRHQAPWWTNEFSDGAVIFSGTRIPNPNSCSALAGCDKPGLWDKADAELVMSDQDDERSKSPSIPLIPERLESQQSPAMPAEPSESPFVDRWLEEAEETLPKESLESLRSEIARSDDAPNEKDYADSIDPEVESDQDKDDSGSDEPEKGPLKCLFWFKPCRETFRRSKDWATHCFMHLKLHPQNSDKKAVPLVPCPVCGFEIEARPEKAAASETSTEYEGKYREALFRGWRAHFDHLAEHMEQDTSSLEDIAWDHRLIDWMWETGVIESLVARELRMGKLTQTPIVTKNRRHVDDGPRTAPARQALAEKRRDRGITPVSQGP